MNTVDMFYAIKDWIKKHPEGTFGEMCEDLGIDNEIDKEDAWKHWQNEWDQED